MLDTFKQLLIHQFEAALCALHTCVDRCPQRLWDRKVGKQAFCQVVFHTLFYTDFLLVPDADSFRRQRFHLENSEFFRDYEEFEDCAPTLLYEKTPIREYVQHCRRKVSRVISAETEEDLTAASGFQKRDYTRAELHLYNIRHIQHHVGQLCVHLRVHADEGIPWFASGWRDI